MIVFAIEIKDRYCSSRMKSFIDRGFFKTHQPRFPNCQEGYIVAGPLSQTVSYREYIDLFTEFDGGNLCGIVSDEYGDSKMIDDMLDGLAKDMVSAYKAGYYAPETHQGRSGRMSSMKRLYPLCTRQT